MYLTALGERSLALRLTQSFAMAARCPENHRVKMLRLMPQAYAISDLVLLFIGLDFLNSEFDMETRLNGMEFFAYREDKY